MAPRPRPTGPLPENFAAQLAALLGPGQAEGAAAVIAEAARLDDERLGSFLGAFAARVAGSPAPLKADELDRLLADARGGAPRPRTAAPSSSSRPPGSVQPTDGRRGDEREPPRRRGPGPRTSDRERG